LKTRDADDPKLRELNSIMSRPFSRRSALARMGAVGILGVAPRATAVAAPPSGFPARPLAEQLAVYADSLRFEDLDAATIERVKTHVIDTIGCGIGAFDERSVRICRDVALAVGGNATIIGTNRRTTPDLATFANCAAFRFLDFNDTYVGRFAVHPSDHIAACLAVAEAERSSAQDLMTSIVIAYEVNCRLVDALDIAARGWDPPVMSLPAVALAAGKLMKLGPDRLTQAVNIAINDHIPMAQTRVQTLSDWKGLADAEAGRNAVFAALLARAGLTGPAPIFEGHSGFFQQVSGPATVDANTFGRRGVSFRIHQCSLKPYPAVIYTQTAIVAGIEVAKDVGSLDRIAAIEIATTRRGYQRTGSEPEKWSPQTRETADHSLPYITARAMFDGNITNESFSPEMFRDPRILAFMQKIKVSEDPVLTARVGAAVPTRVTAILLDGQRISREVDYAPGFAERPMNRVEVERKFRGNVGKRWPKERTDAIVEALWRLDQTDDLATLLGTLSVQTSP
jgi:2-methylcitrate dehydratase